MSIDATIRLKSISTDIDAYLQHSESTLVDIKAGTEKTINWRGPTSKRKSAVSLVYIHEFSASRQEAFPLCEIIVDQLDAIFFIPA